MPTPMALYPLFADLKDRAVLVVGGGPVAERKIATLMKTGARVSVGAREVTPVIGEWTRANRIGRFVGCYDSGWLDDAWLVVATTGDPAVNARVARDAERRRIFVNVVDDAERSTFHVPAVIDRSPLLVAISSGGAAPMLARALRESLETVLDHALGPLATLLGRYRAAIRAARPGLAERRDFYATVIRGRVAALLRAARPAAAEHALRSALGRRDTRTRGEVVLVGAGPGDPGLLTLHALRALNEADVILYDRLVGADVLDLARRDAARIDVGKRTGAPDTQARIHALMLAHARAGRRVVRLKGGDPFVFGRGGEEIEFLRAHDIAYRIVPGVTAALACAAYAGVPLTHRDHAHSVQLATARGCRPLGALDEGAFAAPRQTLVFYMGVDALPDVRRRLLEQGRDANTPFALVENGTRPDQRVVTGTLADLVERARDQSVRAPALLIVGEVAAFASRFAWFGESALRAAELAAAA